jgi:methionyl-tRNA synthetase
VTEANQYIVATAPWTLAKAGDDAGLDRALAALARCLIRLAIMAAPFLPAKAEELWRALGCSDDLWRVHWGSLIRPQVAGLRTVRPPILFPKLEQDNSQSVK